MTQVTTSVHKDLTRMSLVTELLSGTPRLTKHYPDQEVCLAYNVFLRLETVSYSCQNVSSDVRCPIRS